MKDLQGFLGLLSGSPGELLSTAQSVNPRYELTRVIYKLEREGRHPAVLFNNVGGFPFPVVTNLFGNRSRMAMALETDEAGVNRVYREREKSLIPPVTVGAAPVQEVVFSGDRVDLGMLPVVTHNGGDAGPYITGGIMTVRDPETGIRNSGIYRLMIQNERQMGIHLAESSHAYYIYQKYCARKEPMPVAITLGAHPALYLGSLSFQGIDTDEFEVMGGLLGEALEIVKCVSVDLEVPAHGEICLEGSIDWETRVPEGPVGEWHTLYSEVRNYPVVTVKTITMRQNPVYLDICSGATEHLLLGGLPRLGQIYRYVKGACPGVQDVYMPPSGFCRALCYVALNKLVEGEPANGAAAVFAADPFVRHVVMVDADVNIFDDAEVLRAINLNTDISKCFMMGHAKGSPIDPTSRNGVVTKVAIDATRPLNSPLKKVNYDQGLEEIDLAQLFGDHN
jgi:2,5-furandicarboxylate decarboxylase 1